MQNISSIVRELPSCRTSDRLSVGHPLVLICVPGCSLINRAGELMAALSPCCLATETPKQLKQAADCIMNCVACQAALLRLADRVFVRQALRLTVLKKSPEAWNYCWQCLSAYPAFTAELRVRESCESGSSARACLKLRRKCPTRQEDMSQAASSAELETGAGPTS